MCVKMILRKKDINGALNELTINLEMALKSFPNSEKRGKCSRQYSQIQPSNAQRNCTTQHRHYLSECKGLSMLKFMTALLGALPAESPLSLITTWQHSSGLQSRI